MNLRRTMMFFPKENPAIFIKIEIYVSDVPDNGYWNVDTNQIFLSNNQYNDFNDCKTQSEQGKFFKTLKQISNSLISNQ